MNKSPYVTMKGSKIRVLIISVLVVGLTMLFFQCQNDNTSATAVDNPPKQVTVPSFNRDSAYAYVAQQVAFGPRVLGSEGHQQCKEWLVSKLKAFGAEVVEQDFEAEVYTGDKFSATNIIGQYNPAARKRVVLAAHWDTRHIADSPLSTERKNEPILGADDGGSGVGVLLEIARNLQSNPIDLGVDIVLFDAEDYGDSESEDENSAYTYAIGAQYWARNPHRSNYQAQYGILLDMVGTKDARFPKEGFSMRYAAPLVNRIWDLAARMGYGNYFANVNAGGITDDHRMVNEVGRIPMIDIINLPLKPNDDPPPFGSHWHTHNDDMHIINKRTLKAVGQVVTAVIYREAGGNL